MNEKSTRRKFIALGTALPISVTAGLALSGLSAKGHDAISRVGESRVRIALNAYSFNKELKNHLNGRSPGMTLLELLEFCARYNIDAVDLTGYYFPGYPEVASDDFIHHIKRRAFQLGIEICGTGVRNNFATADRAKRAADVEHIKSWIRVAAKLGAPVLRVFAGHQPSGHDWDRVAEWIVSDLKTCVEYGRQFGIIIGVQNHGDMLSTAKQVLHIVEMVDSDWLGVIVDTGQFLTEDPYKDIEEVSPYAVNFQLKESPFGKNSTIRTDLVRLVGILRRTGYRGYLPIETLPLKGRTYDPFILVPQFLAELRTAIT